VGSFRPNAFELHDTRGTRLSGWRSVGTYRTRGAPNDGSARANGDCSLGVLRGGSFADKAISVRSSARFRLRRGRSLLRKRLWVARDLD
jgi:formylglycine-generating enzyme required for sulfatase activity